MKTKMLLFEMLVGVLDLTICSFLISLLPAKSL